MTFIEDWEVRLIRALNRPLPLVARPFADVAERAGLSEEQVIERVRAWVADGTIRRFGARVNHRSLGYTANGMAVWRVDDARVEEVGRCMAAQEEVSHCYVRRADDVEDVVPQKRLAARQNDNRVEPRGDTLEHPPDLVEPEFPLIRPALRRPPAMFAPQVAPARHLPRDQPRTFRPVFPMGMIHVMDSSSRGDALHRFKKVWGSGGLSLKAPQITQSLQNSLPSPSSAKYSGALFFNSRELNSTS